MGTLKALVIRCLGEDMLKKTSSHALASLMLLIAALIWGFSFVAMKNTLSALPPNLILAIRFTMGALGLSFALIKFKDTLTLKTFMYGAVMGLLLYGGFVMQTYGLQYTTVGKNAFITGVYVVLVPLLGIIILKRRPRPILFAAAILCFVGLGLISLGGDTGAALDKTLTLFGTSLSGFALELFGDGLTLVSGIFFALHIVFVDKCIAKGANVMALTCLQFAFAALYSWINTLATESFPDLSSVPTDTWGSLLYIGLLATLLALTLQNYGIEKASSSYAALLLCLEAPFGSLAAIVFLNEKPTTIVIIGFVVICAAMILAQIQPKRRIDDVN